MPLFIYDGYNGMHDPQLDFGDVVTHEGAVAAGQELAAFVMRHHPFKTAIIMPMNFLYLQEVAESLVLALQEHGNGYETYGVGVWQSQVHAFQRVAELHNFLAYPKGM